MNTVSCFPHSPRSSHRAQEPRRVAALFLGVAALLLAAGAAAQDGGVRTQTMVLQPGWNSIFVEVIPQPADLDAVFNGLPVKSVWGWFPPIGGIDFVSDPDQGLETVAGWHGWFPRPRPEALLSNLFGIEVNRAYLVELEGSVPVTVSITGRPVNIDLEWVPDSFNLVGFQVDPNSPPSLGAHLAPSPAHAGQPIYRLDPSGVWQVVTSPYSAPVRSGEAYWIFTQGPSQYQGPLEVESNAYDGLEYSAALDDQRLTIRNRGLADSQIHLRPLPSTTSIPFMSRSFNATGASLFNPLPADSSYSAAAGQSLFLQLGVQRSELAADRSEQLLEITDGLGSRRLVFAGVTRVHPEAPLSFGAGSQVGNPQKAGANPYAGLWIGEVTVNKVSEAQTAGTTPMPVGEAFRLRLLIHVDEGGQPRLLKEVTQMWKEGTTRPDANDPTFQVVDQPGRYVLLTDQSLIPNYKGPVLRDGSPVGLRLSTVAYDFPENHLSMTGAMGPSGLLEIVLTLGAEAPTNPYKHTFHPDHDNLDAQFLNPKIEAYEVTRTISIQLSPDHPANRPSAGWGSSQLGGTYRETVAGVHRNPIYVEGLVFFTRIAATAQLNG